jgi:hypothetical protein
MYAATLNVNDDGVECVVKVNFRLSSLSAVTLLRENTDSYKQEIMQKNDLEVPVRNCRVTGNCVVAFKNYASRVGNCRSF